MQALLFPRAAWQGYNAGESSLPMTASPSDLSPEALAPALAGSLVSQLCRIASDRGFRIAPARIAEVSWRLLGGSGEPARPLDRSGNPEALPFDEESFELYDYLHFVPEEWRRALGQVMTPPPIARYILRAAQYQEDEAILERALCDPACGSGVFLVEAVRICLAALRRAGVPPAEQYPIVLSRFVGIDVDPLACLYARFNLSLLLGSVLLSWMQAHPRRFPQALPIHRFDTLEALAAEKNGRRPAVPLIGSFDFVVGNPPYRKVSPLSPTLREAFQGSLYGHPNAYGMFLHAGIEMLHSGGRLGYIVPRSMLSGLYFQNLRRMIEQRTDLEELSLLAERKNVFPQVLQGTMIIVFRKPADGETSDRERSMRTGVIRSAAELGNGSPAHVAARTTQVARRLNGSTVWFVSDQERTYSLLDKIIGQHPLLGGPVIACPARTGPIVWNRVKPLLRPRAGEGRLPLVWATDVGRFRFELASSGDTRPAYLEATDKVRDLAMTGTSLLIQRVTADEQARRIVASRSGFPARQRYFVENHLNVLQPASSARVDLQYLLGVLSSDVVEFLFRSMNGNTQVSATELNLLPIPRGSFEGEIAESAAVLEHAGSRLKRVSHEGDLNERVARAYGLTRQDLGFLQGILRENPAFRGSPA
jgi:adenine-specific DNA-methyltransferase